MGPFANGAYADWELPRVAYVTSREGDQRFVGVLLDVRLSRRCIANPHLQLAKLPDQRGNGLLA
jgi:hypothetical protein